MPEENDQKQDQTQTQPPQLDLDEVLAKDPSAISEQEKTFLSERQDYLSDDELSKYGLERKLDLPEPPKPKEPEKKDEELLIPGKEEDLVAPEEEAAIGKIAEKKLKEKKIDERLSSVEKTIVSQSSINRIDSFIRDNPEYTPFRQSAIQHLEADPDKYGRFTAQELVFAVSGKEQRKIGARLEREAQKKTRETETGGGTTKRQTEVDKTDWKNISEEEYWQKRGQALTPGK